MLGNAALTAPRFVSISIAGPFAPDSELSYLTSELSVAPASSTSGDAVASAMVNTAGTTAPKVQLPRWVTKALGHLDLSHVDLNHGPVARLFQQLAESNTQAAKKLLAEADRIADALGLDDELLDSLVEGLLV